CAPLVEPEDYEGLLVYASPQADEILEEWQHTLLDLEASNGVPVTLAEAERHLDNLKESVRGDPLGQMPLADRRRAVGSVQAAEREGTVPRRQCFLHRVELHRAAGG